MAVTILGRNENPYDGLLKGVYIRFSLGKQVWSIYKDGRNIGRREKLEDAYSFAEGVNSGEIRLIDEVDELKLRIKSAENELRRTSLLAAEVEQLRTVNVELRRNVDGLKRQVESLEKVNEAIDRRNNRLNERLNRIQKMVYTD